MTTTAAGTAAAVATTPRMTETPQRRSSVRPPGPLPVAGAAVCLFLVVLAVMAVRVRAGADPVIGPAPAVAPAPTARTVVVHRVVRRVVVVHEPETAPRRAPVVSSARATGSAPVPAPASAPAASAPAPALAPAPAPAPVSTRAS
jgi:hypothetical protein